MNGHTTGFRRARSERGQAFLLIVVVVAILLLGVLGLGTDYAQIWAHRQMTQARPMRHVRLLQPICS
jgi:hypothetical protein